MANLLLFSDVLDTLPSVSETPTIADFGDQAVTILGLSQKTSKPRKGGEPKVTLFAKIQPVTFTQKGDDIQTKPNGDVVERVKMPPKYNRALLKAAQAANGEPILIRKIEVLKRGVRLG